MGNLQIRHVSEIEDFCRENSPTVAVLCIPKATTQEIADKLVSLGLKAFWNFSHYDLSIEYENIVVENVHLGTAFLLLPTELTLLTIPIEYVTERLICYKKNLLI